MKFFLVTAFIFLLSVITNAQDNSIKWEENKSLQWVDFSGKENDTSRFDAECYAEICYSYTFYDLDDFDFEVEARFDKNTSWSRKGKQSDELLKHEQLHFDIAQLFANELKHEFENFNYTKNYQQEIVELFQKKKLEYKLMQQQYDDETNHSLNKQKQKEWFDLVYTQLSNTEHELLFAKTDEKGTDGKK
jgi:hypothetical protein